MHTTAYNNCLNFFKKYYTNNNTEITVVDFGSYDINGSLKPIFEKCKYIGIDMEKGPNVDIVCSNNKVPLDDNSVDLAVSSSCFEHDECFWESFLEICRVVKNNCYIYINAPSAASYHPHPVDCWRFYPDSWKALEKYANKKGYNITLIENYIDETYIDKDSVGIFLKN